VLGGIVCDYYRKAAKPLIHARMSFLRLRGFFWWMMAVFFAKPPAVAGEPIADLMLSYEDRSAINGALFKLDKREKNLIKR
jgi:hypothetical protein